MLTTIEDTPLCAFETFCIIKIQPKAERDHQSLEPGEGNVGALDGELGGVI